jgi:hypothetical protein
VGIHDVLAAGVCTGRGDRELSGRLDHSSDLLRVQWVLDADPPGELRNCTAANAHVATGADRVVVETGVVENRCSAIDRPALHEPGGIDGAGRCLHVEVPGRLLAQLLAALQDVSYERMSILAPQLAAVDPADLAVVLVGAEGVVHPVQPLEELLERGARLGVVADVDDDRQAHDVLDSTYPGECRRSDGHAFFAFRIAAWSDCAKP